MTLGARAAETAAPQIPMDEHCGAGVSPAGWAGGPLREPRSGDRYLAWGVNSPSAAIRGRCQGGLREGGWLAYGHWLMRVSHAARRASVTSGIRAINIR